MKDFSPTLQFISKKIADARKEKGITQEEFAEKLGRSRVYVVGLESEDSAAQPTVSILYEISEILDKPISYFLPERMLDEAPPVFLGEEITDESKKSILKMIQEVRNGK